jgi:hypothetical protein
MSYCRTNGEDSDVYLIGTKDYLQCFGGGWRLEQEKPVHAKVQRPDWATMNGNIVKLATTHETHDDFTSNSRTEMLAHLEEHRAAGHKVPERALDRLRTEITELGDTY